MAQQSKNHSLLALLKVPVFQHLPLHRELRRLRRGARGEAQADRVAGVEFGTGEAIRRQRAGEGIEEVEALPWWV